MTVPLLAVAIEVVAALLAAHTHLVLSRAPLPTTVLLVGAILLEALVVSTTWPRPCGGLDWGGPLWPLLLLLLLVGPLLSLTPSGCFLS